MNLKDLMKLLLPKPRLPQKRYFVIAALVIYYLAKAYVTITPSKEDDAYPDNVRDAVVTIFANSDSEPDPTDDYDKEGLRYGEGYN